MGNAVANGEISDSLHRTTGNVWSTSERFQLQHEHLAFKLGATAYDAKVVYTVTERAAAGAAVRPAVMYFPVVCQKDFDGRKCIERFRASINGRAVTARPVPEDAIANMAGLRRLARGLSRRLPADIRSMEEQWASTYHFFEVAIPAAVPVRELTVSYRAAYSQIAASTSKYSEVGYEKARMLYDFSPAASWAGSGDKTLRIDVDARGVRGHMTHAAAHWPFIRTGDTLALDIRNPDFARLPPLVLSIDNGPYLNFTDAMQALKDSQTRYSVSVPGVADGRVRAASDRDASTSWCWRGRHATLDLRVDDIAIGLSDSERYIKEFEGIVILNGASGTQARASRFGAARKVQVSLLDADAGTEMPLGTYPLSHKPLRDDHDQFRLLTTLWAQQWPQRLRKGTDEVADDDEGGIVQRANVPEADRWHINQRVLRLRLHGTRSGRGNENCISEIYPLYNGG